MKLVISEPYPPIVDSVKILLNTLLAIDGKQFTVHVRLYSRSVDFQHAFDEGLLEGSS